MFFFFKDTATTDISNYGHTLSLPDALPICTELKSPFGERKASQRKIHDRMTREGHDHFGVAIPGGGFFLLLFVCFIIHIRVPFFRLKSRERSVQSLRS